MKKLACTLLSLLIVIAVYANTNYIATSGGNPVEFELQAYKPGNSSSDDEEKKYSITITNYIEKQEQLLGKENYEYKITKEDLNGEQPLFDIVYRTNTFDKHIDFKVEISAFEYGNRKIPVSPNLEIKYKFEGPPESVKKGMPTYKTDEWWTWPDYIDDPENSDVIGNDYDLNESFAPSLDVYYNKYKDTFSRVFGFDSNNLIKLEETSSFSFSFYSDSLKGPVHVVSKNPEDNHQTERYVHKADAVFTATAYVSAEMPTPPYAEGSYRMHVTITAVESAP